MLGSSADREVDYGEEGEEIEVEVEDQEGQARQEGRRREEEEKSSGPPGCAQEEGPQGGAQKGRGSEAGSGASAGRYARPCRSILDVPGHRRRPRRGSLTPWPGSGARGCGRAHPRPIWWLPKVAA